MKLWLLHEQTALYMSRKTKALRLVSIKQYSSSSAKYTWYFNYNDIFWWYLSLFFHTDIYVLSETVFYAFKLYFNLLLTLDYIPFGNNNAIILEFL